MEDKIISIEVDWYTNDTNYSIELDVIGGADKIIYYGNKGRTVILETKRIKPDFLTSIIEELDRVFDKQFQD